MSSMNFGDEITIDPATMRGRDWPTLKQFGVFLENRVGNLGDLLRKLEGQDLRIIALSIVDSIDFAIARIMVNQYERCREILSLSGCTVFETDMIGVQLPDVPQPYVHICMALMQAEISIHYTYPLLYRRQGHGAIALYVDDVDLGLKTLSDRGLRIITENDLMNDDEFF